MRRRIIGILCIGMMLISNMFCYAAGEFDTVNPEELSKEDLIAAYNELRDAYNEATTSQKEEIQDISFNTDVETDIVFEDLSTFFETNQNYEIIIENINNFKIEELKTAIGNYLVTHQNDATLLNAILDSLNKYGDFENLICETDSFSGETNIIFEDYTGIDSEHYIYPHYSEGEYLLRLGFVKDDWLFAERIILKRDSESMEGALYFEGASYEFERDTIDGGMIREYKEESLYHTRVDKFLENMDENIVIRFEAENGEILDYSLTENDKKALQNIAKYSKLVSTLSDIYDENELYYSSTLGKGIVSGRNADANSFQFSVELTNKDSEYYAFKYYANFDFLLTNNYDLPITEINGLGIFLDPQGKEIIKLYFDFKDIEIQAGASIEKQMYYECKSYEDIYDISFEDLTLMYIPEFVTFADGTTENF